MLGHPVPPAYLRFLASYPAELATKRYEGLDRLVSALELYVDPAVVMAENRDVRDVPVWGAEGESAWPAQQLVIGMDLSGDVIFIVANDAAAGVQRYLCDSGEDIVVAPDVATYATMLATDDPTLRKS